MYLHLLNTWIDNEASQIEEEDFGSRIYYFFPFSSFCECVCVCFCVRFCLYSFAFTICPTVRSIHLFFFFFYLKKIFFLINFFLIIFFLFFILKNKKNYFKKLKYFFLNKFFLNFFLIFYFNSFIYFYLSLFYFILSSFFLSIFSPFYSEPCGWKDLGVPARQKGCTSEVGEPTSGHWSTRNLPAPHNTKWQKSLRDLHLNTKTQLHSATSKLRCWTPYAKQLARQEHSPID